MTLDNQLVSGLPPMPSVEVMDAEVMEVDAEGQALKMTRWPQMNTLMRDFEDVVLKILRACDECEVVKEVTASDAPTGNQNVKGNKWARLWDHVFGGRDDGTRGLISELPVIAVPSKLKKKVVGIWQHGQDPTKVSNEVHVICKRQFEAYDKTCKTLAETNKKAKDKYKELTNEMRAYEESHGALPPGAKAPLPPGAKPDEGGGRMNHSTNLHSRQPAGYGYVVQQAADAASVAAGSTAAGDVQSTPSRSTPTPPQGSGAVNTMAMNHLGRLGNTFESVIERLLPRETVSTPNASTPSEITIPNGRKRKHEAAIEKATKKKKELAEQVAFMSAMKDDTPDNQVHFNDISRQYIRASKELLDLINSIEVDTD